MSLFTWKRITAFAIVVAGAVGAFAVYTFGWKDTGGTVKTQTVYVTTSTGRHRLYTVRQGDVIRDPVTLTQCETSHEAGIPNLFCTHAGKRSRYQVVFWSDAVDVYDLARHGEPMVPTFSVPAKLTPASG